MIRLDNNRLRIPFVALAALAVAAVIGGCGGGGASGAGGPAAGEAGEGTETKAEFIKAADAICAREGERIQTEAASHVHSDLNGNAQETNVAIKDLVASIPVVVIPRLESELQEIRGLNPSAGVSETEGAILAAIQELIERTRADPERAIVNTSFSAHSEQVARSNGFKTCGVLVP